MANQSRFDDYHKFSPTLTSFFLVLFPILHYSFSVMIVLFHTSALDLDIKSFEKKQIHEQACTSINTELSQ
jgi:hypothetical protein